ncbi:anaerobic ribonucleoside-triphosphate reductase activating protein [Desulfospira joergensenii]|uniref:anaerobic ribonucleoside-triphosphate reductase activating protein n=1 Tax=Desulfospira joergensenii TaxID=53329 RepID=UPI0003B324D8|nr:anaerobic ribonucleoside-triphosphate reductase activating protein [Desulfospira joergensenii]
MNIGGFQKNSLIDFPQTLACVVFTSGCNFNCPYCHNPDLAAGPVKGTGSNSGGEPGVPGPGQIDPEEIFSFLKKRKAFLEGVVITGGEPTLQPGLPAFLERVRELGYRVKLDTNGTRPAILARLFENRLVDYTAMDIKTGPDSYPRIAKGKSEKDNVLDRIEKSIRLIMEKSPGYEFRTTCVRPFVTEKIMEKIAGMIRGAEKYVLQNCSRDVHVLTPEFLKDDRHFFSPEEIRALGDLVSGAVTSLEIR